MATDRTADRPVQLSQFSRNVTWFLAVASAVFGGAAFLFPSWAADSFPWAVTDFQAMTIGAWALGNAFSAWYAARDWNFARVHPILVYLWSFSVLQTAVLVWHLGKLATGETLTMPYVLMLGLGTLGAVVGVVEWVRSRRGADADDRDGMPVAGWVRALAFFFILFVTFLAGVAAFREGAGSSRKVFPEPLTPFTVRAFGAFYLSLVIGAIFVARSRWWERYRAYGESLLPVLILTTGAAFVYIGIFDLSERPTQWIYLIAYLAVLVLTLIGLAWGRAARRKYEASGTSA